MVLAHGCELILSFFFPDWPRTTSMLPMYVGRVGEAFAPESTNQTFKAITEDVKIVGMAMMKIQTGEKRLERNLIKENEDGTTDAAVEGGPKMVNGAFVGQVIRGLADLDAIMLGRRHYMLSSMAVHPDYQGKGIGRKLLEYCNDLADSAGLPTYLTAFPGAHGLYQKLGYKDIKHFDVDLNEWGTKHRGYGIYRSYGMLRKPQELEKSD